MTTNIQAPAKMAAAIKMSVNTVENQQSFQKIFCRIIPEKVKAPKIVLSPKGYFKLHY
jgi:hypothetical protein